MTTPTKILTDEQIEEIRHKAVMGFDGTKQPFDVAARAIGQAVLQSPEVVAMRKDAERYRRLRRGSIKDVAVVRGLDAMDYGSSGVASTYSEEIDGDDLDAATDAAMQEHKP